MQCQNSVESATTNENLDLNANSCWQKIPQHSLEMEDKISNSHAISEEDIHKIQVMNLLKFRTQFSSHCFANIFS